MTITILSSGPLTTVQDRGRTGHAAQGYPECGACDAYALTVANLLVGNDPGDAALEMTLTGAAIRFGAPSLIALAGAFASPTLNGAPVPMYAPIDVPAGGELEIGSITGGIRMYLAVRGGIDVPPVLGSRATDLKCHLGGYNGRALRRGDEVPIGNSAPLSAAARAALSRGADILSHKPWLLRPRTAHGYLGAQRFPLLRYVPGPQVSAFTPAGQAAFASGLYTVTADSNRMALKLSGPAVETVRGADILSDGILAGSIQISANGQPILMLADHQTTGGYAKIGTLIPTDLPAAAQLLPGSLAAFRPVSVAEGIHLCREEARQIQWIKECLQDE